MSTAEHQSAPGRAPSEETPEFGVISIADVVISQVAHWMDGDLFVFRSTEFDVIAADEKRDLAIKIFIDNAQDYADMVGDLAPEDLTQDEAETALLILRRMTAGYERNASELRARLARRVRVVSRLRGRGHDAPRQWYRKSSLPTSSPRLPV